MLNSDHDNTMIFYVPKKKNKSHTGIPESVKAIGNVMTANTSALNAEMEIFSKKKGRKDSLCNTSITSRTKGEVGKYAHSNRPQAAINRN